MHAHELLPKMWHIFNNSPKCLNFTVYNFVLFVKIMIGRNRMQKLFQQNIEHKKKTAFLFEKFFTV